MIIFTDGAATMKCINGEYQRENGGAAMAVIQDEKVIYEETKHFENTTNNYCELYAILMALKYFKKEQSKDILKIYSDSTYCVNMLKSGGWIYSWAKNGWTRGKKHEPIENLEIIKEIYSYLEKSKNIDFIKVKGHSGEKDWNDYVDKLAVKAKMEV